MEEVLAGNYAASATSLDAQIRRKGKDLPGHKLSWRSKELGCIYLTRIGYLLR